MSSSSGPTKRPQVPEAVMQMLSQITDQMTSIAARIERLEQPVPPPPPDEPELIQRGGGRGVRPNPNPPYAYQRPFIREPVDDGPPERQRPYHGPYDRDLRDDPDPRDWPPQHRPYARNLRDGNMPDRPHHHQPDVKLNPPMFSGKLDPEAYMDWERRMELLFEYYRYEDPRRVALATAQFTDHALTWWDREVAERRRARYGPLTSWDELTQLMRRRYVPPHFHRELQRRFRRLNQGTKSVSEYFDEFEHLRNRLEVTDSTESLMAQFLDGLQEKIARKVERQPYHDLGELFHLANQVEQANKRKASTYTQPKPNWTKPYDKSTSPSNDPSNDPYNKGKTPETSRNTRAGPGAPAENQTGPTQRSRDITCFKCNGRGHMARDCPNQRVMIVTASGDYESADEDELETVQLKETTDEVEYPDTGELLMMRHHYGPEEEDEELTYPDSGELLVIRRMLSTTIGDDETAQLENIFYSKCTVPGKEKLEKKMESYNTNKGRKQVILKEGDWVWLHMRPERFPQRQNNKLAPRRDGPFQILKKINDKSYQLELPGEFNISPTFNVSDLEFFDADEESVLETKSLEEGGNDEDIRRTLVVDRAMEVVPTAHGPRPEPAPDISQTNGLFSSDQDPRRLLSHQTAGSGVFTITFG